MIFDTWYDTWRVAVATVAAYATLILFLRVSGKRTLAKLNAFDLVVSVALGSTLATIALSPDIQLLEGTVALATLVSLQFVVAWVASRSSAVRDMVKADAVIVAEHGTLDAERIRGRRLTVADVHQAIRSTGLGSPELVAAVVLEADGTLSVIPRDGVGDGACLRYIGWSPTSSDTS